MDDNSRPPLTIRKIVHEALTHAVVNMDVLPYQVRNSIEKQLTYVALIAEEVGEVSQELRRGPLVSSWKDHLVAVSSSDIDGGEVTKLAEELADVILYVATFAGIMGIDLDAAVRYKITRNKSRPKKHGGKLI